MTTINCDMGESFGLYKMGDDAALMPLISVANVARGFHASDFNHMRATVRLAKQSGVKVGAHPSLPDLQGFGRREMKIGRDELADCLIYQIGARPGSPASPRSARRTRHFRSSSIPTGSSRTTSWPSSGGSRRLRPGPSRASTRASSRSRCSIAIRGRPRR
jgi:hypothetical protein